MKKLLLTILTLIVGISTALADEVKFDFLNEDYGMTRLSGQTQDYNPDPLTITSGEATINATGRTRLWSDGFRYYTESTISLSVAAGATITGVEITFKNNAAAIGLDLTSTGGTWTVDDKTGTWQGSASSVDFKANITKSNGAISSIVITYTKGEAPAVLAPSISKDDDDMVTITCPTEGASIYYTLDGTDPTASSTLYTAPFKLTANATVKAVAIKDGQSSSVASKEFSVATTVASIAEFLEQKNADAPTKIDTPLTVLYQSGSNNYVTDNKGGYLLLYGNAGATLANGNILSFATGKYALYNEAPQMALSAIGEVSEGPAIAPAVKTVSEITMEALAQYVKLEKVTVADNGDGKNFTITDAQGNTIAMYNTFKLAEVPTGENVTVTGMVTAYRGAAQIAPITIEGGSVDPEPEPEPENTVATIAEFLAKQPTEATTINEPLTVLYKNGRYLYVKDAASYLTVYGTIEGDYKNGNILSSITGTYSVFREVPQLAPTAFGTVSEGSEVAPEVKALKDVTIDMLAQYIKLENVTIADLNGKSAKAKDAEDNTLDVYNTFNITLTEGENLTVVAIVTGNNGTVQIAPISIEGGSEEPEPGPTEGLTSIAAFIEAAPTTATAINAKLGVIYQNGRNLYLKDEKDGYILAYNQTDLAEIAGQFQPGEVIDGITGTYKSQSGLPEIIPTAVGAKTSDTWTITPEELTIEEFATDLLNHYIVVKNVTIAEGKDAKTFVINDGTAEGTLYNTFVGQYYDPNVEVTTGTGFTVTGFLGVYSNKLQLIPVKIEGGETVETVATPTFDPAAGEVEAGTAVSILCATEGAAIHYTTDGTEPTAESALYSAPIVINATTTLKAIAVKEGMLDSKVASATYSIAVAGAVTATFNFGEGENVSAMASRMIAATNSQEASDLNNLDNVTLNEGTVAVTFTQADGKSAPRWWNNKVTEARVYNGNKVEISIIKNGLKLSKVSFTQHASSSNWAGMNYLYVTKAGVSYENEVDADSKMIAIPADQVVTDLTLLPTGTDRFATLNVEYVEDPDAMSGVEAIEAADADAPVLYYNLRGQQVEGNLAPGLYIRRQGTTATKVYVK